jgi:hypothetical protein
MPATTPEAFVNDQIPTRHLALFPQCFRNAYAAVEALAKDEPILQVTSARINRGHLRTWAVETGVERLITSGQWPVDFSWASFARPTGKYLRVRLADSTMTVCQVKRHKKVPRPAAYRTNNILNNSPFLDLDPSFEQENEIRGLPHLILVHGYHNLDFIHLGLPHPNAGRAGYIYQSQNLLLMPHVIASDLPVPEAPDANPEIELLKEQLKKWRRDNEHR